LRKQSKKFLQCHVVSRQDLHQASDRQVRLSIFNPPIVHPLYVVVIGKAFMACIAFLSPELSKCRADIPEARRREGLLSQIAKFKTKSFSYYTINDTPYMESGGLIIKDKRS
jgi:hypothetical protein